MIIIQKGEGQNIAEIMAVMDSAFDPYFGEAWTAAQCLSTLSLPGSQLLIARHEHKVVGFTLSRAVVDEEELLLIAVDPSTRRIGVGRQLLNQLFVNAAGSARTKIFLEVREQNQARHFYSEMGFKPIGLRPKYYKASDGNRYDSVTMGIML
jgi:[ribosomal protein S18]-alanine N-acetyltransferase